MMDVVAGGGHVTRYAQSGSRIVFTLDRHPRQVYVADLDLGAATVLAIAPEGQEVLGVDISGDRVAWLEGRYEWHEDRVPCQRSGSLTWRLMTTDLANDDTREVTSSAVAPS